MSRRICKVPHPRYGSFVCQREPDHDGNHSGRRGGTTRVWVPYLSTFAALTRGVR